MDHISIGTYPSHTPELRLGYTPDFTVVTDGEGKVLGATVKGGHVEGLGEFLDLEG